MGYTEMGRNIDLFTASFLGGSVVKKKKKQVHLQCRRCRFDLWVGRIPREGNGNPLQ